MPRYRQVPLVEGKFFSTRNSPVEFPSTVYIHAVGPSFVTLLAAHRLGVVSRIESPFSDADRAKAEELRQKLEDEAKNILENLIAGLPLYDI